MKREEFINYIECIGFVYLPLIDSYVYKELQGVGEKYEICFANFNYMFHNGIRWEVYEYGDIRALKKFTRSYKLKQILA